MFYLNELFGVGGVVVRPEFLDDEAFDIPDIAWLVDDVWLSAMLARKRIRIYFPWRAALPGAQDILAQDALMSGTFRDQGCPQLNRVASAHRRDRFGVWG